MPGPTARRRSLYPEIKREDIAYQIRARVFLAASCRTRVYADRLYIILDNINWHASNVRGYHIVRSPQGIFDRVNYLRRLANILIPLSVKEIYSD